MSLSSGTRLGPHEILGPLGAGGMGEVYRARDTRLGRDVAVKVLPETLAADPERMARFDREARVLASLNHPNIAAIYGVEQSGTTTALVMELVEGPTLGDRMRDGPMPVEDAIPIATQIAEALEAAHDSGVVHRDLKPANVKVRPDGRVKVLDFGLAKAMEGDPAGGGSAGLSHSPTLTQPMTMGGMIIGTAAYMAPEQAKGKGVDRRADIWAFGVVLFEMLAGRQLFQGETASETLAAVMKDPIPWASLPGWTPPAVRRLLERCLTRDPRLRLQSIGEARIVLAGGLAEEPPAPSAPAPAQRRGPGGIAWAAGAVLLAAIAFASAWTLRDRARPQAETRKYPLALGAEGIRWTTEATVSPDGSQIAFYADGKMWVRNLQSLETRFLAEAQTGTMRPSWSPDGSAIAFCDGTRLMRISAQGGSASPICTPPASPAGGTSVAWTGDGRIVFSLGSRGLFEVRETGGDPREILPPDSTTSDFHEAYVLPGDKAFLFVRHRRGGSPDRLSLFDGKEWRDLFEANDATIWRPAWSPTGHILFHRIGSSAGLWALPFSLDRLEATGEPILVTADGMNASFASDGTLLYSRGLLTQSIRVVRVDRRGAVTDTLSEPMEDANDITLSPDGRWAALSVSEKGNRDIGVLDLDRGSKSRLTFDPRAEAQPCWAPDGKRIYYASGSPPETFVYAISAHGGEAPRRVTAGTNPAVSREGTHLACVRRSEETAEDIYLVEIGGDSVGVPIVVGPSIDTRPDFAPGGRFIAYESVESGRQEVFVSAIPPAAGRWQVSDRGGRRPRWSADGRKLYFQSFDLSHLVEVDVQLGETPSFGYTRVVFDIGLANIKQWAGRQWDVAADQESFVALALPAHDLVDGRVVIVENWYEEFRKR